MKSSKNREKRFTKAFSSIRNYLDLNWNTSEIKRFGTNELKIDADYENSEISTDLLKEKTNLKIENHSNLSKIIFKIKFLICVCRLKKRKILRVK